MKIETQAKIQIPYTQGADPDCQYSDTAELWVDVKITVTKKVIEEAVRENCNGYKKGGTFINGAGDAIEIRWDEIE